MKKKLIGVDPEAFNKLVEYLGSRPHKEVNGILVSLSTSLNVDVDITPKLDEPPKSNEGAEPPQN
jgi:hypothetical protein